MFGLGEEAVLNGAAVSPLFAKDTIYLKDKVEPRPFNEAAFRERRRHLLGPACPKPLSPSPCLLDEHGGLLKSIAFLFSF